MNMDDTVNSFVFHWDVCCVYKYSTAPRPPQTGAWPVRWPTFMCFFTVQLTNLSVSLSIKSGRELEESEILMIICGDTAAYTPELPAWQIYLQSCNDGNLILLVYKREDETFASALLFHAQINLCSFSQLIFNWYIRILDSFL